MPRWLAPAGINYVHLPELGGRRAKQDVDPDINAGWRQPSFKNYADHTLGPQYRNGIERLAALAMEHRVAIMCGEPMPWRCHRLLIANTLTAQGWTVWHLMTDAEPRRHELDLWGATLSGHHGVPPTDRLGTAYAGTRADSGRRRCRGSRFIRPARAGRR